MLICCHLSKRFAENFHKAKGDLPEKWISFIDNPDTPEGANDAFYFAGYEDGEHYIGQANETRCEGMKQKKLTAKNVILHVALQAGGTKNVEVSVRV